MNRRTVSTPAARRAATEMRALLDGDLTARAQELVRAMGVLADPQLWDGPAAMVFRQTRAPQFRSSLMGAVHSLQQLQQHVDKVLADIMHAGEGGAAPPTTGFAAAAAGAAVAGAASAPPLDQKTKDMLAYFRQHINDTTPWGDRSDLLTIDQRLAQLSPAERAAFLSQLSPAELQNWNSKLNASTVFMGRAGASQSGLTNDQRLQVANLLYGSASPADLAKLEHNMPGLQPSDKTQYETPKGWSPLTGPLFGPNGQPQVTATGSNTPTDINQGNDGDCWFLSGLGAVAMKDPSLIQRNIQQNPNGTYTVTFYRNGQPVPVTVTPDVPGTSSFGDYAHPGSDGSTWVQVYEKAYAQFNGGYGGIDGGFGSTSMADITGQPSTKADVNPTFPWDHQPTLSDLSAKLNQGYAITTGTQDGKAWPWSSEPNRIDSGQLVPSHEYMVQSVNMNANPPTVTLQNPWGQNSGAPETVTLTQDQWHQYFSDVSENPVK